ncbi:hypothetical protein [Spirosoma terrae]|uniref:Uncharacterized protein n=1 Tax=Spirosoma terrae TaxID=1968276 RepID=A0A6L9LA12_9BACT|nr:hypothetical protein [Spirosoma terrae]NDU95643.1 hypothetical protein [Spirosoma terrae]
MSLLSPHTRVLRGRIEGLQLNQGILVRKQDLGPDYQNKVRAVCETRVQRIIKDFPAMAERKFQTCPHGNGIWLKRVQ